MYNLVPGLYPKKFRDNFSDLKHQYSPFSVPHAGGKNV